MSAYSDAVLALSPTSYWPFSGGSPLADAGSGAITLTTAGSPTRVPSIVPSEAGATDGAYSLDGNDGLLGGNNYGFTTQDFTLAIWLKPTTVTNNARIMVKFDVSVPQNGWYWWMSGTSPTANGNFDIWAAGTGTGDIWDLNFVNGQATFIAVTWVNSTKTYIMYQDGAAISTETNVAAPGASTVNFSIGCASAGNDDFFNGVVDEAAVWNGTVLSGAQISNLWTVGSTSAVQTLAPSADSVDGAWTDQAGGTSLFAAIDETTASDTDYIRSPLSPSSSACRVKLASGSDPASSTGHKINWRVGKDVTGGQTIGATVTLRQGGGDSLGAGTQIATFTRSNVDAFTTYTETLSGGEADAITNYADLYLEFSGNAT